MRIADFHSDILTSPNFSRYEKEFSRCKIVAAVFKGNLTFDEALRISDRGKIIAFEDVGYDDFDFDKLKSKNPVYVGLTWNGENRFGYGCNGDERLKKEGVELIDKLNSQGIAVDTAHISKGGFKDIIERAKTVVNSHTCFNGIYEHKRNLDDWQIELLVERNALIGLTFCGYFMTENKECTSDDVVKEIDYFTDKYGINNLCIGTDFYGCDFLPKDVGDYENFENLQIKLYKRGYKAEDIDRLFYGNLNNFLEKTYDGRYL